MLNHGRGNDVDLGPGNAEGWRRIPFPIAVNLTSSAQTNPKCQHVHSVLLGT